MMLSRSAVQLQGARVRGTCVGTARPIAPVPGLRGAARRSFSKVVPHSDSGSLYPSIPSADSSFTAPPPPVEVDLAAAQQEAEQEMLREASNATRSLSFVGFWLQFALSVVSGGVLLFSVAFVPKAAGAGVDISKYLTLVGVIAAFISSLFAHGFLTLSKKIQSGGTVAKNYLVGTLLTNNAICLAGIAITVIGLQASVGTLVAKTLMTAVSGPLTVTSSASALVSLDVFALQASTNTLLCHVIGLLFTNLMLRLVNRAPKTAAA